MLKLIKFTLLTLLAMALLLGLAVVFLPDHYEVRREITIDAEAADIHPYVEEFARWERWCPWNVEAFPSLVNTYSGPERGVDCAWSWTMDEGPGGMVVTASDPERGVWFDLSFGEPGRVMHSKGVIQYLPAEAEGSTTVAWSNQGQLSGVSKLMGPLLDSMMGRDFESGLTALEQLVESAAD